MTEPEPSPQAPRVGVPESTAGPDAPASPPRGSIARGTDIAWILTRHGVHHLGAILAERTRGTHSATPPGAKELRLALQDLGPTYVKLGQLLSTRGDLLPPGYAEELSELQSHVRPISAREVRRVIRAELGADVDDLFETFDDDPLAAASIAQVHRAELRDDDGRVVQVVVKVRRPDVAALVESDLHMLTRVAELLARTSPHARDQLDPESLAAEFAVSLRRECDFRSEGAVADALRARFAETGLAVQIPEVYLSHSSEAVLTMERVTGTSLHDLTTTSPSGTDRAALARVYADAFMAMVFSFGLFHADPHPGNVFAHPDGSIALIDFGKYGRIDDDLRGALRQLLAALVMHDADQIVGAMTRMQVAHGDEDPEALRDDVVALVARHADEQLAELDVAAVLSDMLRIIRRHHLRMPPDLMLLLATVVMCEGVAAELDPGFQLQPVVLHWVTRGSFGASSASGASA